MSIPSAVHNADLFAQLQAIQDELAPILAVCLVLVSAQGREVTLPSGLPLVCNRRECTTKCPPCLQSLPAAADGKIRQCPFGLYWAALPTTLRSGENDLYLHVGRTTVSATVAAHLTLLQHLCTLPLNVPTATRRKSRHPMPDADILTAQERKVLACLAAGMTNKEVAQSLCISLSTVKTHISNIFKKLGITNRTEATIYALKNGISLEKQDVY